jgi:hypothetical protein
MKILKILLIILVPAIGIVSCKKSNVAPRDCATKNSASSTDSQSSRFNSNVTLTGDDDYQSTDVVGSGDDDRDGGDRPKKVGSK